METTPIGNPTQLSAPLPTPAGQFASNDPVPLPLDIPEAAATPTEQVPVESNPPQHPILKHFEFDHLPLHLQGVSKEFHALAHKMHASLPMDAELIAGLRKLLEAKDCMVRAANL